MWGEFRDTQYANYTVSLPLIDYCIAVQYFYDRRLPKNMILAGLWFNSKKPQMHMYLKPIFDMLLDLEKTGLLSADFLSSYACIAMHGMSTLWLKCWMFIDFVSI